MGFVAMDWDMKGRLVNGPILVRPTFPGKRLEEINEGVG